MKPEVGIWILSVLGGIQSLIAWQADKNRKSFEDSLRRFILFFTGLFLVVLGILFFARGWFELSILQNNFLQPDIWQWIFFILLGVSALAARQIDKNNRSFNNFFRRSVLLIWGVSLVIVGLWFLIARMFGYSYYNLIFGL